MKKNKFTVRILESFMFFQITLYENVCGINQYFCIAFIYITSCRSELSNNRLRHNIALFLFNFILCEFLQLYKMEDDRYLYT